MRPTLLTINAGSSSVRLGAFEARSVEKLAGAHHDGHKLEPRSLLRAFADEHGIGEPVAVAHRVVHGGARLTTPRRIDPVVEAEIEKLAALAPLHNPRALQWIRAARSVFPESVPQVAVFDTAFYAALPEVAATYALPRELCERLGIRRFGFHGIAHEAMLRRWQAEHGGGRGDARVVSLQLGAGCSITASRGGAPVDTSMGFSPLEGLVMATRCGDVDAGLVLHLMRTESMDAGGLHRLLNEASGLLGVSGETGDMRALMRSGSRAARLALDLYAYRARKYVGAFAAALGGIDAVLFGGGVGENAAPMRAAILQGLEWAGIAIDPERNAAARGAARIDAGSGPVEVHVMPVDEASLIAEKALALLE